MLAVAEYLSFHRVANALGVSQSSVSARIKALEEDLGILLFERNTRGVRLTEAGRLFVERVSAGVEHLDHAVKSAGMAALGACGRLRMGVHGLIPHSFLTNLRCDELAGCERPLPIRCMLATPSSARTRCHS